MRRCCFEGIDGSFWKVFSIVTRFPPSRLRAYSNTTTRRYYERVCQRDLIEYTYIYILKQQRKNEFWRHAPRGRTEGNTQHTDLFLCVFVFDATTLCGCGSRAAMRRNPIHLFFSCFRARVCIGGVDISSFFAEMIIPLSFCVPRSIREGDRVFQNALFVRERERETNG